MRRHLLEFGAPLPARLFAAFCVSSVVACGSIDPAHAPQPHDLRINEIVSNNEGVYVDELGQSDDYVELINTRSEERRS